MKIFPVVLLLAFSSSAALGEMYTWKDAKGTSFYTNSLHEIPARYLKRARVLDMATGKKGGPVTAHPGVPSGPAVPAAQAPVPPQYQAPPVQAQQPAPPASAPTRVPAPAPAATVVATPRPQQRSTLQERRAQRRLDRVVDEE